MRGTYNNFDIASLIAEESWIADCVSAVLGILVGTAFEEIQDTGATNRRLSLFCGSLLDDMLSCECTVLILNLNIHDVECQWLVPVFSFAVVNSASASW